MDGKTIPTGVKVIAVLNYIAAGLAVLGGIMLILGGGLIGSLLSAVPLLGALGGGFFIVIGIVLLGFAVLYFLIGRGLWKAKNWARIVSIVLAVLGVIMAIFSAVSGISAMVVINLALNLLIGGYLAFSRKVKEAFA